MAAGLLPPLPPVKATFTNLDGGGAPLTVRFNPETIEMRRKVSWSEQKGSGKPYTLLQFSNGTMDSFSVELLLDNTENTRSLLPDITMIYGWTLPIASLGRPPCMLFTWNQLTFQGVVEDVKIKMQLFDDQGNPKRAMVEVELVGIPFAKGMPTRDFFTAADPPV